MDILSRPVPSADHRIAYGADRSQFGDLWLPEMAAPARAPLVVVFHGGWWKSQYDLGYMGHLCAALKRDGIACWSAEYRRVGATHGGWPQTFADAAAAFDYIAILAERFPLDLTRVIAAGHSAGGHLAFWNAGRHHLDPGSALHAPRAVVPLLGSVALAGAVDLRLVLELAGSGPFAHIRDNVYALLGGTPAEQPERYARANPGDLLPFNVPQLLLQGSEDDQIPPSLPSRWVEQSRRAGDTASARILDGADHFDVVDPQSNAWPAVRDAIHRMLRSGRSSAS